MEEGGRGGQEGEGGMHSRCPSNRVMCLERRWSSGGILFLKFYVNAQVNEINTVVATKATDSFHLILHPLLSSLKTFKRQWPTATP